MKYYYRVTNFSQGTTKLNIVVEANNKKEAKKRALDIFNSYKKYNNYKKDKATFLKNCHHKMIENGKKLFCYQTNTY